MVFPRPCTRLRNAFASILPFYTLAAFAISIHSARVPASAFSSWSTRSLASLLSKAYRTLPGTSHGVARTSPARTDLAHEPFPQLRPPHFSPPSKIPPRSLLQTDTPTPTAQSLRGQRFGALCPRHFPKTCRPRSLRMLTESSFVGPLRSSLFFLSQL
ncbi:hypothetical protein OH76DRAFT_1189839 [Lentinus brumalis]|uniref:Uncharacterized protein n=1 Tax=Lentinus brumalis TaxID=2498619 RepID=A0A371CTI2_9APHY|nr:hypothetical protein OH76DRAFT_1189839 [Polyporus brumalis]